MIEQDAQGPELFVGLVGATGTDMARLGSALERAFPKVGYAVEHIRVIDLLSAIPGYTVVATPEDERLQQAMDAGDRFRKATGRNDALAMLAITHVIATRQQSTGGGGAPRRRTAYILRGLKRPEEVQTLRRVYGLNFVLVGAYSPRSERVNRLSARIARSKQQFQHDSFRADAERLIERDLQDQSRDHGQRLRDVFALADVFVHVDDEYRMGTSVDRFVELLFGHPYHTPTRDEAGMFFAHAAALRSAALARQVGAAITTKDGSLIALGCNDVPRAGGGLYWCSDEDDSRDFRRGEEASDVSRQLMARDIMQRLNDAGWLEESVAARPTEELADEALKRRDLFRGAHFDAVLEFGRIVHAEMAALTDAARRGVSTSEGILYTTTFPCHNCARHIVAAGIERVVFIEPYPKSRAIQLHEDSIVLEGSCDDGRRVRFEPFVGVSPRLFGYLFQMPQRKNSNGSIVASPSTAALPRLASTSPAYIADESSEAKLFLSLLQRHGVSFGSEDKTI